jgi:hypothetical protein
MFWRRAYSVGQRAKGVGHRAKGVGQRADDTMTATYDEPCALCSALYALRCPLCGKQFRADETTQCAGCALAARCGLVMCPNCGYEFAA